MRTSQSALFNNSAAMVDLLLSPPISTDSSSTSGGPPGFLIGRRSAPISEINKYPSLLRRKKDRYCDSESEIVSLCIRVAMVNIFLHE